MATNLASATIKSTGSTTSRTLGDRFAEIINVKDYGAKGDNSTNDRAAIQAAVDAAFGTAASPNGGVFPNYKNNKALFFPSGVYLISSPILLTGVRGGWIFGEGRFATTIKNSSTGSVFVTNAFDYCHVEHMHLMPGSSGVAFDLDYDGNGTWSVALQSNTFHDMFFEGGTYGLRIGNTGFMGSENLISNCYFISQTVAGLSTRCGNALQQSVIGGNFQSCPIGILVAGGSVPIIHGVGFQNFDGIDIKTSAGNNQNDGIHIAGCRSESDNFVFNDAGMWMTLSGNSQYQSGTPPATGAGYFYKATGGNFTLESNRSVNGQVILSAWAIGSVENSSFGRSDWLSTSFSGSLSGSVRVKNVLAGGKDTVNGWASSTSDQLVYGSGSIRNYNLETSDITSPFYISGTITVTLDSSTDRVTFSGNHGRAANDPVAFTTTGSLAGTGITANTTYFVKTVVSATVVTLSATSGGALLDITANGTATHSALIPQLFQAGDAVAKSNAASGGTPGWVCTTSGYNTTGGAAVFKARANLA